LSASGKSSSSRTKAPTEAPSIKTTGISASLAASSPLPSPGGVWDLRDLNLPLLSRPSAVHSPRSGLDALVLAVACQEGS
jgi:hypothetical protein